MPRNDPFGGATVRHWSCPLTRKSTEAASGTRALLNAFPAGATALLDARGLSERLLGLTISKPDGNDTGHFNMEISTCNPTRSNSRQRSCEALCTLSSQQLSLTRTWEAYWSNWSLPATYKQVSFSILVRVASCTSEHPRSRWIFLLSIWTKGIH